MSPGSKEGAPGIQGSHNSASTPRTNTPDSTKNEGQNLKACEICRYRPPAWVSPTGHDVCETCLFNDFHRTVLEAYEALSECRRQLDVLGDWIVENDPVTSRTDFRKAAAL